MAERSKAADLKSAEAKASVGSNPTCPAKTVNRSWVAPIRKPDGIQTDSNCDTTESDAEHPTTRGSHSAGQQTMRAENCAVCGDVAEWLIAAVC